LPTYNRPEVLGLAIESVLRQTVSDFELLVLGDGCTDHTADVVTAFDDPRVHWLDLPKAPYYGYANINVGLRQARGEFCAYMAHDDLWLTDHLELLLKFFTDDRIDIAYSRPLWVSPEGHVYPLSFNLHDPEVLDEFVTMRDNSLPAACFVFRRASLERTGLWDEMLERNADWDMWTRIIKSGGGGPGDTGNFAYLPLPTCLHFQAIWKTDDNPGPIDLFAWKHLYEEVDPALRFGLAVDDFATEQAAFAEWLQSDAAEFSAFLRTGAQRLLDRMALDEDRRRGILAKIVRDHKRAMQRLDCERGVFEHRQLGEGSTVIFGPGCFAAEQENRWLWREARMMLLTGSRRATAVMELACGEAAHYDTFPFEVTVKVSGKPAGSCTFTGSGQRASLSFEIERPLAEVELQSSGSFVPSTCGLSDDNRELSVVLTNIKING
jgi:glycosyltransferase involved in cell wall biosynthesis